MNVEREAELVLPTLAVPFSLPHYHKTQCHATEHSRIYWKDIQLQLLKMLVPAMFYSRVAMHL